MGGISRYHWCLMPFSVLSYCDFLCSVVSFWVTLIAIADVGPTLYSWLHMVGLLLMAMGMKWNQQSYITKSVPLAVGCAVVLFGWVSVRLV